MNGRPKGTNDAHHSHRLAGPSWRRSSLALALAMAVATVSVGAQTGCSDDSESSLSMEELGPSPNQFFEAPPLHHITFTFHSEVEGEAKKTATVRSDSEVDIDGRSFRRLRGAEGDEDENLSVSMRYDGDFFEVAEPEITDIDGLSDVEMQGDPIRVPMNPPVGEEQPVEVEHWEITIDGQTFTQSLTGSYSRLDEAATVETPQGEIGGCRHYRIDGSADEVAGLPVDLV